MLRIEREPRQNKQARDGKTPDMHRGIYQGHQGERTNQGIMKGDLEEYSDCSIKYTHMQRDLAHRIFHIEGLECRGTSTRVGSFKHQMFSFYTQRVRSCQLKR